MAFNWKHIANRTLRSFNDSVLKLSFLTTGAVATGLATVPRPEDIRQGLILAGFSLALCILPALVTFLHTLNAELDWADGEEDFVAGPDLDELWAEYEHHDQEAPVITPPPPETVIRLGPAQERELRETGATQLV